MQRGGLRHSDTDTVSKKHMWCNIGHEAIIFFSTDGQSGWFRTVIRLFDLLDWINDTFLALLGL